MWRPAVILITSCRSGSISRVVVDETEAFREATSIPAPGDELSILAYRNLFPGQFVEFVGKNILLDVAHKVELRC